MVPYLDARDGYLEPRFLGHAAANGPIFGSAYSCFVVMGRNIILLDIQSS